MKFGANCGTPSFSCCVRPFPRSPVMRSARAPLRSSRPVRIAIPRHTVSDRESAVVYRSSRQGLSTRLTANSATMRSSKPNVVDLVRESLVKASLACATADPPRATASAASATSAASAPSTTSTASATSAASAASAASGDDVLTKLRCFGVFLVEDIECRQADVGDFLLIESDFVTRGDGLRRYYHCRPSGCCGCAARQRQRHPDGSQYRYSFLPIPSLRSMLRTWHIRVLHAFQQMTPTTLWYDLYGHLSRSITPDGQ